MLKDEQGTAHNPTLPLTYGSYLRVPELVGLQSPLSTPVEHDEMLFIIVQQAQELWFKQLLHELHAIIAFLGNHEILQAIRLLRRANAILRVLGAEVTVLETMPPQEFQRFRHVLSSSSGFESEQFRELELASGLDDAVFLKLVGKHMDMHRVRSMWPQSLADTFRKLLRDIAPNSVDALVSIYTTPQLYMELYMLAESLADYETLFGEWRFHHIKLVERTIGDRAVGTAGSTGAGYLTKTLGYRFFPELLEARNKLSARAADPPV